MQFYHLEKIKYFSAPIVRTPSPLLRRAIGVASHPRFTVK
jgi:hypothetical protein